MNQTYQNDQNPYLNQNHICNELKQNSKQFGKHNFFESTKVIKNVVIHQVYFPSSSMSS